MRKSAPFGGVVEAARLHNLTCDGCSEYNGHSIGAARPERQVSEEHESIRPRNRGDRELTGEREGHTHDATCLIHLRVGAHHEHTEGCYDC